LRLSRERDSSGTTERTRTSGAHSAKVMERIARRKPQKKHHKWCFFCVRSGSPKGILLRKIQLKIKN
jgi:hypothetical protein